MSQDDEYHPAPRGGAAPTEPVILSKASPATTAPIPVVVVARQAQASPVPVPVPVPAPPAQPGWAPQAAWTGYGPVLTDQRPVGSALIVIAWLCAFFTVGYMLPWAIAATRGRSNQAAVGLVNFLLGWSFIGWVVALVMACQAHAPRGYAPVNVVVATQHVAPPYAGPPAGWYQSPTGPGQEYWDGHAWTGHRAP